MYNLIIIGKNTDKIAKDIWKGNTNYTILNQNPNIFTKRFLDYITDRPVIISTTNEQFMDKGINEVIDYFDKHKFIPIFISDGNDSMERNMYTALVDGIRSSLLYTRNEKNQDYDVLLRITRGYLIGKGIISNDDKTIRTPRKRKKSTTQK